MADFKNRRSKRLDELPGLFDLSIDQEEARSAYADILRQHRQEQMSPKRPLSRENLLKEEERVSRISPSRKPELEYISFGSGSSGNCSYIGIRGVGGVIVDAGIDVDLVIDALKDNYIDTDKIAGIVLTHDHSDHVRVAYKLLRHLRSARLYCTPRTINGMLRRHSISKRIKEYHSPIFKEFEFSAGPLTITPFEVSHDGSDNVGLSIQAGNKNFVVATDMGMITDRADHYMRLAHYLMIETNYDRLMLDRGTYPEYLKARIRSYRGHLDNEVTAKYLAEIWTERLTDIYLCHLSKDNNTPEIALKTVREALCGAGATVGDASGSVEAEKCSVQLYALPRYDTSPLFIHRL